MSESTPPPPTDPDATFVPRDDETFLVERAGSAPVESAPFRIGPYLIEEEIGRGGMGVVYRGRDQQLGRTVAVKVLPRHYAFQPQARARFRREAEAASKLDHPGLCGIIAVGEEDGLPWIAMPFLDGIPLSALIDRARKRGDVSAVTSPAGERTGSPTEGWSAAVKLMLAVARALQVAHDKGVLHRDLKPGNVMMRPDGRPVVLDFGLATDTSEDGPGLTASGDVLGTPSYMAPEQIRGEAHRAGPPLDVWAMGVMLYELLTLELPFASPTREGVYRNILEREPPALRRRGVRAPGDIQVVVSTALAKDVKQRYASAKDFADDLQRVLDIEPILARRPGPVDRAVKLARRRPASAALVMVLVLVVPTLLGLWVDRVITSRRVSAGIEERLSSLGDALERREPVEAARLLTDVLALAPEHPDRAELAERIARLEALAALEALVLDRESDPTGSLAAAELEAVRGRWPHDERVRDLARLVAVRAGREAPSVLEGQGTGLQRALEHSAAGRHELARRELADLLEKNPSAHWIAWAAADEASRVQRYDEALALARAARAATRDLVPRRRGRYSLHLRRAGELELALEHALRAHGARPSDVVLRLHLANALAELGRRDEARGHLETAIAAAPGFSEAWRALGALQFDDKDWSAAEDSLRRALDLNPRSIETMHNLANVMIETGRFDDALVLLDQAISVNPDFVFGLNSKGHLLRRLGRFDEARLVLTEAIVKRPRYAEAIANLGSVHFAEGDAVAAEKLYREAAALEPRSDKILFNLALLLHNHGGEAEEIIGLYRRVLEVRPDDATSLTNLANLLTTTGRHEEAVKLARRSTELAPDDAVNWNNLATSCVEAGLMDDAVTALERASSIDPAMLQPHVNLMIVLAESDPIRALAHALEVPRIDPEMGRQAQGNVTLLYAAVQETDHPLALAMEALDVMSDERDEALDMVESCVDSACSLPEGNRGDRDWIVARSTVFLLLDVARELEADCAGRLLARARVLGLVED